MELEHVPLFPRRGVAPADFVQSCFERRFGRPPERLFFCPGRVNLIGEHIDYNGGLVLPGAIAQGIHAAVGPNLDGELRFSSQGYGDEIVIDRSHPLVGTDEQSWSRYLHAVAACTAEAARGILPALNVQLVSDLSPGAGLSSSAAFEVIASFVLLAEQKHWSLLKAPTPNERLSVVQMCKVVENRFLGLSSGIMDQYAVVFGEKDSVLLVDCAKLTHETIPFRLGGYELLILDSGKERSLLDSKYNERFQECRCALQMIDRQRGMKHLVEASLEEVETWIDDPVLRRRARHVVTEQQRVLRAVEALIRQDAVEFGDLLRQSHISLRDDYEVTGPELDLLVETALSLPGCLGARLTGAGFGGSAIALVEKSAVASFSSKLLSIYNRETRRTGRVFPAKFVDGVSEIRRE